MKLEVIWLDLVVTSVGVSAERSCLKWVRRVDLEGVLLFKVKCCVFIASLRGSLGLWQSGNSYPAWVSFQGFRGVWRQHGLQHS